jgi:hypothetical protein
MGNPPGEKYRGIGSCEISWVKGKVTRMKVSAHMIDGHNNDDNTAKQID